MTNRNSKALGRNDPRPRTPQDKPRVRYPLVERDGEIFLELSAVGGLAVDPARGAYLRVHDPLAVLPGSPFALTLKTSPSLKTKGGMLTYNPTSGEARDILVLAAPTTGDVRDSSGDTLTALLQRLQDAYQAADSGLDTRIDVLEGASATSFVKVSATLVFDGGTTASVAVTGETNVATAMKFSCMISSEGLDDPLEALLDEVQVSVGSVVDGDGFTVYGYAPNGSNGTFIVHVVGI